MWFLSGCHGSREPQSKISRKSGLRPQEARSEWIRLVEGNGLHDDEYSSGENLIWNGRFQISITERLFDWVIGTKEEVARTDLNDGLRIEFLGTKNIDLYGLSQLVVVEPGASYKFSFRTRSEGVTTEQGPYFEIVGSSVLLESEQVLGTTDWEEHSGAFRVPRDRNLVRIPLRRRPSKRIDSRLAGTLRLNSVTLQKVS